MKYQNKSNALSTRLFSTKLMGGILRAMDIRLLWEDLIRAGDWLLDRYGDSPEVSNPEPPKPAPAVRSAKWWRSTSYKAYHTKEGDNKVLSPRSAAWALYPDIQLMFENGKSVHIRELDELPFSSSSHSRMLKAMVWRGEIEQVAKGRYQKRQIE